MNGPGCGGEGQAGVVAHLSLCLGLLGVLLLLLQESQGLQAHVVGSEAGGEDWDLHLGAVGGLLGGSGRAHGPLALGGLRGAGNLGGGLAELGCGLGRVWRRLA